MVGGRQVLGLSKYLADVTHEMRGDRFSFGVTDRDTRKVALKVSGRIEPGVVVPSPTLVNIGNIGDEVTRVAVDTDSSWRIGPAFDVRIRADPDDGHLGRHVADL